MKTHLILLAFLSFFLTLRTVAKADVGDEHELLALQGTPDPRGSTYAGIYPVAVDENGVATAYEMQVLGGPPFLYRLKSGGPNSVIGQGSRLPFAEFNGWDFSPAGHFAVRGARQSRSDRGIFAFTQSSIHRIAAEKGNAAGYGTFEEGQFSPDPAVNDVGQVAFAAATSAGKAIFLASRNGSQVTLKRIASLGDNGQDGGLIIDININDRAAITSPSSGQTQVAFIATSSGAAGKALYLGKENGIMLVKANLPTSSSPFSMNNAGQVVFDDVWGRALYLGDANGSSAIITESTLAPGGGTIDRPIDAVINDAGDIAFTCSIEIPSPWTFITSIMLRKANGTLIKIASVGDPIDGGVFEGEFGKPQITHSGFVMFTGTILRGTIRNEGIFLSNGQDTIKLLAVGDPILDSVVIPTTRFLSSLGPEPAERGALPGHGSMNESGQVLHRTTIGSGKVGIFLSTPAIHWRSGASGLWDDPQQWTFRRLPSTGSNVMLDPAAGGVITSPTTGISVRKLRIGNNSASTRVEMASGSTLATTGGTTVTEHATLSGGSAITGGLRVDGTHERDLANAQRLVGLISYANTAALKLILRNPGTPPPAPPAASQLTVASGASVDLVLNAPGSTVDFSGPFWLAKQSWRLFTASKITGDFTLRDVTPDSNGQSLTPSIGAFSLRRTATTVDLVWIPYQTLPVVTAPADQLVTLGTPVTFETVATGGALSYRWTKNRVSIAGAATSTFHLPAAKLTDAASYIVTASNDVGSVGSSPASRLVVVNPVLPSVTVTRGSTLTLKVPVSAPTGTLLSYEWFQDGDPLANGQTPSGEQVSGANTSKLVITRVTKAVVGSYMCRVTVGSFWLDTSSAQVLEIDPPTILTASVPASTVSASFLWQLEADESPTSFSVSGLPSGLIASATGIVSGTPNVAGTFSVRVSAKNRAGTGAARIFSLVVESLPDGTVGTFSGLLSRSTLLNGGLAGAFTLSVTRTGSFTGSVKRGGVTHSLRGRLLGSDRPTASLSLTRSAPLTPLSLNLTLNGSSDAVVGSLADGAATCTLEGKRHVWSADSASAYPGIYNAVAELPSGVVPDPAQPQGTGWQQMTVKAAGTVTGTGRTPDGVSYTFSGSLWPDGTLPQFLLLYGSQGSITGQPHITLGAVTTGNANNRVDGWVEQIKLGPASSTDRLHKTGIPLLRRNVDGSPWIKPNSDAPIVLDLDDVALTAKNASIQFSSGGLTSGEQATLRQDFRIAKTHSTSFSPASGDNPAGVRVTITPATGLFTTSFTLTDGSVKRAVLAGRGSSGILLSHRSRGVGYFLLPGLSPSTTTSDILSGSVEISPLAP